MGSCLVVIEQVVSGLVRGFWCRQWLRRGLHRRLCSLCRLLLVCCVVRDLFHVGFCIGLLGTGVAWMFGVGFGCLGVKFVVVFFYCLFLVLEVVRGVGIYCLLCLVVF